MRVLGSSDKPLSAAYDVAVLDLDGVVYVGSDAVPGAAEALNKAQSGGMHLAFVTNNASRPPETVGEHLRELGVDAHDEDVVTSAQAAARLLVGQVEPGSKVFLMGGPGLEEALRERDLEPVTEPSDDVAAVAQGYGPDMPWKRVVQGSILVRAGLPWVVSNTDMTIPTETGLGPGNGTLVRLVAKYAGREPQVAGKPMPPLFEETIARVGGEHPLLVGDRLDTDIAGAVRMGWDSLLVLTGVTGLEELVRAGTDERPTYLAPDLAELAEPQEAPERTDAGAALGGWTASVDGDRLAVSGDGSPADWWRVVAVAAWAHLDDTGQPVATEGLEAPR
ncbi:MAG: HAD-IIA family hydrolase [Marmoricola sp.]